MGSERIALCVDLDGTLVRSDMLIESSLALLRKSLWFVFLLPIWLMGGKARLKREIAERVELDVAGLPYNAEVLALCEQARVDGRCVALCTATDQRFADAIARHLGCFDRVLGSDGNQNLSGKAKASALVGEFGERKFDYAGDSRVDTAVWAHANGAIVVGSESLARHVGQTSAVIAHIPPTGGGLITWVRQVRAHQWLKNVLVFAPLFAGHRFADTDSLAQSMLAFLAFCGCASGAYLLNDILDLASDRRHERKRSRPLASGDISIGNAFLVSVLLTVVAFLLAGLVSYSFMTLLAFYWATTVLYSLSLKRVVMVDVVVLAGLYTLRIIGGAIAIDGDLSFWLLAFSMFTFLSLAMLKRYTELLVVSAGGRNGADGRGYEIGDLPIVQSLGSASGYCSVLVLALYINSAESMVLYARPEVLWLLCPIVLYWLSRAWIVAHRGLMHDDPVVFAVIDRTSQVVAALSAIVVVCAI